MSTFFFLPLAQCDAVSGHASKITACVVPLYSGLHACETFKPKDFIIRTVYMCIYPIYSLISSYHLHTCFYCLAWHNTPINYVRCAVFSCFTRKGCLAKCLAQKVIGSAREITGVKKYEIHSAENAVPTYWTSKIWQTTKLNNEYWNPKVLSYRTKQAESNICSAQILQWLQLKSFQNVIDSSHSCVCRVWRKNTRAGVCSVHKLLESSCSSGRTHRLLIRMSGTWSNISETPLRSLIVWLTQHLSYPICTWLSRTHGEKLTHDGSTATMKEMWQLSAALHFGLIHCTVINTKSCRLAWNKLFSLSRAPWVNLSSAPLLCSTVNLCSALAELKLFLQSYLEISGVHQRTHKGRATK